MERVDGDERTVPELRAALRDRERELVDKERQLECYARDLRDTYLRERARGRELASSYVATVRALANAVEARDSYTGQHAERVAAYGLVIADAAGTPLAADPQAEFGFLLHDIGKVAVPDSVLFKPEPLSRAERSLMERHAVIGWEILREVHWLGDAKLVVRHHHERWDGAGYPDGLAGEAIPLAARVFAGGRHLRRAHDAPAVPPGVRHRRRAPDDRRRVRRPVRSRDRRRADHRPRRDAARRPGRARPVIPGPWRSAAHVPMRPGRACP
jgi:ribonuclease P protein subunit RPR2